MQPTNEPENDIALSDKERQILKHICDGKTNKEIANILFISPSTVDFHRSKIYSKTHCTSVLEVYKYAVKKGIVAIT